MSENSRQEVSSPGNKPADPPPKGSFLDAAKVCVLEIELLIASQSTSKTSNISMKYLVLDLLFSMELAQDLC
jgi:hypothetical protein